MPLQSKRTVRVHEIPAGTSEKEYLDFVEHLCTKPQKTSRFRLSRVTKHFKGKSKSDASTSASTDEVDEDVKSKDEADLTPPPSTPKGEGEQAAPLLNNSQPTAKRWREITFCFQNGQSVGTISFENEMLKGEALERHGKDKKSCWKDWVVEDNFKGVTNLYEGPDAKFDICAVHGLGGNAIDTWTADSGKTWLRDFLPEHENFKNSRVMTFGYDSDLTNRSTVMELENWAETLLQSLNEVRTGEKEKERPLLVVSHSLGGLVVRKAMARLHPTHNCQNIKLSQCGIVFLATPHSGSTKADWSNFLVATAHTIGGVRPETVKTLQAFNTASVWDTAAFLNIEPCPPFRCFAEGLKMRVKGTNQHIVTQSSATLGKDQAHMVMGVDHSSICKFNSRLGTFVTITMALRELLNEVTSGGVQQPRSHQERRMFGQPRFLAHAYPPDGGFWWEGTELNEIQHQLTSTKPFFGRSKELKTLEAAVTTSDSPKLTVIKGIAGIGKTELLLQFAAKQRGLRNVFFIESQEQETIDSVLSKISTRIGFDMIEDPSVNQERWRSTPVSERIQIFITWLGDACNKESIFMVDDIEAFGYSKIPIILKYPANHIMVSTRDSNLVRTDRDFRDFRLPPLGRVETMNIINSTLNILSSDPASWNGLDLIARRVQGHPLAARNSIPFIMEHLSTFESPAAAFLDMLDSQYPEERKLFLEFSFEGRSLWEAFDASLKRLELHNDPQSTTKLLQILPFLSFERDCIDTLFKIEKRWLHECEEELPDVAILNSGYTVISSWLFKLRGVSFYVSSGSFSASKPLNIHPLVSQYMLLRMDEGTRVGLITQILKFFYKLERRGVDRDIQVKPHVQHCVQVCHGLGILVNSLRLPGDIVQWVEGLLAMQDVKGVEEDPFSDPIGSSSTVVDDFTNICMETKESLQGTSNTIPDANTTHMMLMKCMMAYRTMRRLTEEQEEISQVLKPTLLDAVKVLQEMVRLRNIYPEIFHELEEFRNGLCEARPHT
ncbi:hypothetical protein ACKRZS_004194 [Fusarium odoratissimum]